MSSHFAGVPALLAINVILGYGAFLPMATGRLNLGLAGFVAAGAYGSALLSNAMGWTPVASALVAAACAAALALIVALPLLRAGAVYFALATFALGQLAQAVILDLPVVGAAAGYAVKTPAGANVLFACAGVVTALVVLLFHGRFGISAAAVYDDEGAAELMGLPVRWIQTAAFALGSGIAAFGGALLAHHFGHIEAQSYGMVFTVYVVLSVLLGGTQTPYGPVAGASLFTLLTEGFRGSTPWAHVTFALATLAVLAWRPQGLLPRGLLHRPSRDSRLAAPAAAS